MTRDDRYEPVLGNTSPLTVHDDEVPDFIHARDHVLDELVRFVQVLRQTGAEVPPNTVLTGARALVNVGSEKNRARAALSAALLTRKEDREAFEKLFSVFWRRLMMGLDTNRSTDRPGEDAPEDGMGQLNGEFPRSDAPDDAEAHDSEDSTSVEVAGQMIAQGGDPEDDETKSATASTYSQIGTPTPVAVESETLVERGDLAGAVRELTRAIGRLKGRLWGRDGDERADIRRALRESFGTGGTIVNVPRKERKLTEVGALLLVDVSQSVLDTIDRGFLIQFLQTVFDQWRSVRVFFFDDSVREGTAQFDAHSREETLATLARAETEWGGGYAYRSCRRDRPA